LMRCTAPAPSEMGRYGPSSDSMPMALARAMEPAMSGEEKRLALQEDVEPYSQVHQLMVRALEQGLGVYVWP